MKMKSVVLAAAVAAALSVFADIYPETGDVVTEWFMTNSTSEVVFNTEPGSPIYVHEGAPVGTYDGYAVTAEVKVVVHEELPALPIDAKGAMCAAVTNVPSVATNWYGLSGSSWVPLAFSNSAVVPKADLETHYLMMEFNDTNSTSKVRYTVDGYVGTYEENQWLTSGTTAKPSKVAFSGTGAHKYVKGLCVNAKVSASTVSYSWKEGGFEFTNGTVNVRLDKDYSAGMGTVELMVWNSKGTVVGSCDYSSVGGTTATIAPSLTAGDSYTYAIVQTTGDTAVTNTLGSFIAGAPGDFSALVAQGASFVEGGSWNGTAPAISNESYYVEGGSVFTINGGVVDGEKAVTVDNDVTFTGFTELDDLDFVDNTTFAAITAVSNGPSAAEHTWQAYVKTNDTANGWVVLDNGYVNNPATNEAYMIRAMFDFNDQTVSYYLKREDGSYMPFTCNGSAKLALAGSSAPSTLSKVAYSGRGFLRSVWGGNADTNLVSLGAKTYATIADAMAAATNGNNIISLRTGTTMPAIDAAGNYTILTNGYLLAGIDVVDGIALTNNGYTITLSKGICVVDGGKLNLDTAALNAILGENVAKGKTPAEITAELTSTDSNGLEKWVNYVLDINGSESYNKPYAAPVQNSSTDTLTFALGGVGDVASKATADIGVKNVTYSVETCAAPTGEASAATAATTPDATVTVPAPSSGVQFYRIKVTIEFEE